MNIQSAGEAVFLACEMEKQAVRLYERALLIFRDEKMQQAVREILAEEKSHLAQFEQLGQAVCSFEQAQLLSAKAAKTLNAGGLMAAQRKGAFESPRALFSHAAQEEKNAVQTYSAIADDLTGDAADTFRHIAREEERHLAEFEGFLNALGK